MLIDPPYHCHRSCASSSDSPSPDLPMLGLLPRTERKTLPYYRCAPGSAVARQEDLPNLRCYQRVGAQRVQSSEIRASNLRSLHTSGFHGKSLERSQYHIPFHTTRNLYLEGTPAAVPAIPPKMVQHFEVDAHRQPEDDRTQSFGFSDLKFSTAPMYEVCYSPR